MTRTPDGTADQLSRWLRSLVTRDADPELEELAEAAMDEAAAWADGYDGG